LALGEGDAAGEGLTAGLTLAAGAVPVPPAGEGEVDGDELVVLGELELFSGSVAQPAANMIEDVATSSNAMRLIKFSFGVIIIFLVRTRLKSVLMITPAAISSNGRSHRSIGEISASSALKASFSKPCLHD
jgi:hypothetical protein